MGGKRHKGERGSWYWQDAREGGWWPGKASSSKGGGKAWEGTWEGGEGYVRAKDRWNPGRCGECNEPYVSAQKSPTGHGFCTDPTCHRGWKKKQAQAERKGYCGPLSEEMVRKVELVSAQQVEEQRALKRSS